MKIEEIRPVTLCNLPTPLMEMPVLSAKLGGPQILIKRDDLSGLAMGGQKCRMFEYMMSEAKDMGADVIITAGTPQGNQGPQLAAAACKLGMDFIFFMCKGNDRVQGNLLLLNLLGAEVKPTDIEIYEEAKIYNEIESLANELRSKGRRPYVFHLSGQLPLAIIGYANAVSEICKQLQERGLTAQRLFLASATGVTQAGLSLGVKYFGAPFQIVGIMHGLSSREQQVQDITNWANAAASFFGMDFTFKNDEVVLYDEYMAEGYGIPSKKSIDAVRLVAQTEGILLDPLYTGRAMAALIDQVCEGKIKQEETVIFYHTGGLPAVFTHNKEFYPENS